MLRENSVRLQIKGAQVSQSLGGGSGRIKGVTGVLTPAGALMAEVPVGPSTSPGLGELGGWQICWAFFSKCQIKLLLQSIA